MTTPAVHPAIRERVVAMFDAGEPMSKLRAATGLSDRAIRLIIDGEHRADTSDDAPPAVDDVTALIRYAKASGETRLGKAADRAQAAIDNVRALVAEYETHQREKAARAAQERREREEHERKVAAAEAKAGETRAAYEAAQAALAALVPRKGGSKKGRKLNLTDAERERRRQHALALVEKQRAERASSGEAAT